MTDAAALRQIAIAAALADAEGYAVPSEVDGFVSVPDHRVTFTAADHRAIDLAD